MGGWRDHVWVVGLAGVGLVVGFAARTWLLGGADGRALALALSGATCLLAYAALDRDTVEEAAGSRALRHGSTSTALVLGAAAVAALAWTAVRQVDRAWDLTSQQRFTLTPHTRAVLDGLDQDVELLAFFRQGVPLQQEVARRVATYAAEGDRVTMRLVDPLSEPLEARRFGVETEAGELLVRAGDRQERVLGRFDEETITNAIVRATAGADHVVCWSEGHGEADPDEARDRDGLGAAVLGLEAQNYQVMPVSLLAGRVREDCEVLVMANPRTDLLAFERRALLDWVAGGGRALLMLEPGLVPELAASLAEVGLSLGDDVVLEPDPDRQPFGMQDPSVMMVPPRAFHPHPITVGLPGAALFAVARSVAPIDEAPGVATRPLLRAGPRSWAETDLSDGAEDVGPDADERVGDVPLLTIVEVVDAEALPRADAVAPAVDEAEVRAAVTRVLGTILAEPPDDLPDELHLADDLDLGRRAILQVMRAVSVQLGADLGTTEPVDTVGELVARARDGVARRLVQRGDLAPAEPPPRRDGGRLVVVGDATFAMNESIAYGSNRDLFLNAIAWLAGEDDQLGQRPVEGADRLELSTQAQLALLLTAVGGVPGIAMAMAAITLMRRRKR